MATAKGSRASAIIYEEATYAVAPPTPQGLQLSATQIDVGLTRGSNKSAVLRGDRNPTEGFLGRRAVAGNIVTQPGVREIAFIMKHCLGAVTTTGAGPYTHVVKVGALPTGLTLDKFFADLVLVERYLGLRINSFTFTVNDDGLLEVTFAFTGSTEVDDTVILDIAPKVYAIQPFAVPRLTINEGGAPLTIGKNLTITVANNLDGDIGRVMGNNGAIADLPEGIMSVDISMEVLFQSTALLNKAKNETVSSFVITFPAASAGHSFALGFNEIKYDVSEPTVRGPLGITVPMKAYGFYTADSAASSVIATIINDVTSLATIPA
jgi:hypothetical protein